MGATIVVDAFWGDSGKGKIAAYLSKRDSHAYTVRAGTGTNAGHSIYLNDTCYKTRQLPLAGIMTDAALRVASGVAVDPEIFFEELAVFEEKYRIKARTKIDERCPIITPAYKEIERSQPHFTEHIRGTLSGTGVAQAEFCLRKAPQAKDIPEFADYLSDTVEELNAACENGERILVEGAQGYQLSLAHSNEYPFCTSGNCTTAACLNTLGLNWKHIEEVILVVKAVPSRSGSGSLPDELSREEILEKNLGEYGVNTGRLRRKAGSFPLALLKEAVRVNGPTQIALTFCDHLDPEICNQKALTSRVRELMDVIEDEVSVPVTTVETGKDFSSVFSVK